MHTVWERNGVDGEWHYLAGFQFVSDAQAFAVNHYETQTMGNESNLCECEQCVEGWRVTDWKAYEVRVSEWTSPTDPATADICPVCNEPDYKWNEHGCSCWLCSVCMTTNPEGDNECRSCHTSFCTDCGCVIEWHEPSMRWHGDHVDGCFMA